MLRLNQLIGFGAGGRRPMGVTFTATGTDSGSANLNFGTLSIGSDEGGRVILVGVALRSTNSGATIASATLGGNAGTILLQANNTTGGNSNVSGFILFDNVPAGTTAEVLITFNASVNVGAAVCLWKLMGLQSTAAKSTDTDTNGGNATLTLDARIRDVVFGAAYEKGEATPSWTGIDEDADIAVPSTGRGTWGHRGLTAADAAYAVTGILGSDSANCGCAVVLQ